MQDAPPPSDFLCRDCGRLGGAPAAACPDCGSQRLVQHGELRTLAIAHLDCDAFYASIEKRDDPSLAGKPVIVGGGTRGVVAACCYIARRHGVRSAMPMFKALAACPDAVVLPPAMAKYRAAGREVRRLMLETTPLVEAVSIDEAYLDLTGTEGIAGGPPSRTLARLARRIEAAIGITVSIGLSYNKFLAKIASDLDKPRGYAVLGRGDAYAFLTARPVGVIWGVGPVLRQKLERDGIVTIGDLRRLKEAELVARYGSIGRRLVRFAVGEDDRKVTPDAPRKSISVETTFARDTGARAELLHELAPLCERLAERLRQAGVAAGGATLKLKTADFRLRSRSKRLDPPTQRAEALFHAAAALLERELDGSRFRLIGIGSDDLVAEKRADPPGLFDGLLAETRADAALDAARRRHGPAAVRRARQLDQ